MGRTAEELAAIIVADVRGYKKAMRESVKETQRWDRETQKNLRKNEQAVLRNEEINRKAQRRAADELRRNAAARKRNYDAAKREMDRNARATEAAARKEIAALKKVEEARRRSTGRMGVGGRGGGALASARAGVMSRGGGMLRGVLGTAGVFGGMALVNDVKNFEAAITDLQITGDKSKGWADETRSAVLAVSDATGKSKGEVVSYLKAIIEQTGDADYAIQTLQKMGDVAVATGANMEDLGSMAVKMGGSMKLAANQVYPAMGILRQQEKLGSFTMGNIASSWGKVSSFAPNFGKAGMGVAGVTAVGGLLQMAARTGSISAPEEIATSAARFMERLGRDPRKIEKALGMKAGTLGKMGKAGFEYKALPDVFRLIGEAAAKDPGKFAKSGVQLFGQMGVKTASALRDAAAAGWNNATGKYASGASMFGVTEAQGVAGLSKDKAKREASAAFKFDKAMANLANTFQREALPLVTKLSEHLPKLVSALKFMLEHSTSLIALWLGSKGLAMFKAMGVGTGGGGGAGVPGGPGGGRFNALGVGMTALAFAPLAASIGQKIGEAFAGTSMAKIRAEFDLIRKQDELHTKVVAKRKAIAAWGKTGWAKDWTMTDAGSRAILGATDLIGQQGGKFGEGGAFSYSPGAIVKNLGLEGASKYKGDLQAQYNAIVSAAQADFAKNTAEGRAGAMLPAGAVERHLPQVAAMGSMIRKLDEVIGQQRLTAAGKAEWKLNPSINVTVNMDSNRVAYSVRKSSVSGNYNPDPSVLGPEEGGNFQVSDVLSYVAGGKGL